MDSSSPSKAKRATRFANNMDLVHFNGPMPSKPTYSSFASERVYPFSDLMKSSPDLWNIGKSLRSGVSKVFSEDHNGVSRKILDPRSDFVQRWNKIFLLSCLAALFVDPLFFFLPSISNNDCIGIDMSLVIVMTILRTITDAFYLIHMFFQFRTAYVAPSSRVFGTGVLVVDPKFIAKHYLMRDFWLDLVAVLPLPQVVIWGVIQNIPGSKADNTKNALRFIIFFQYIPRLFLIFPLSSQIIKTAGVVTETAWAGAAYNLVLYVLASHVIGASWYLLAIERIDSCWRRQCRLEHATASGPRCKFSYLYCDDTWSQSRNLWHQNTNVTTRCTTDNENYFNFGIYKDAFDNNIDSTSFLEKYFYCLWWGLRNLSSLGQNLMTSTYIGEIVFTIFIAIVGLVLFALLIGNMQTYLQSLGVRLEEWRVKQSDTEEWMRHRQLPPELRKRVRKFTQYKWVATRGVDEEELFQTFPADLRRDIKRHLCLNLVLQVPLFSQMDERLLDAICERLRPVLFTEGSVIMQEGDPVNEMLFIIRGFLDSATTNGGCTGFFNSIKLFPGSFCGEELLTWALDPKPSVNLPSSTRKVRALEEVEAFALRAEDLKFVAGQFRRLHSKQLQQTFRFYSHQWRAWAARFIQAAWRRYKKRLTLAKIHRKKDYSMNSVGSSGDASSTIGRTTSAMRGLQRQRDGSWHNSGNMIPQVPKPTELEFYD